MSIDATNKISSFNASEFSETVKALIEEIQDQYLFDTIPWVVGYSGGKDSTAVLQLVWRAIEALPDNKRKKPVHVISTDTLVENPMVARWVDASLARISDSASSKNLPITSHKLSPDPENSFWVNLIGKGYPAPGKKFRWCTERLKIMPSTNFIKDMVSKNGEAIVVLGTRKAESQARAKVMNHYEKGRTRNKISPNGKLPNSYVFSPIEDWSNDDVWMFLLHEENPWGNDNDDLLTMYQGASPDGECPLVVDDTTPSCGDSRFGCWVCTLVDKDRSMQAMIRNDEENAWMSPLLKIRDELSRSQERKNRDEYRDFRKMDGRVQLWHDDIVHGPYLQEKREHWLRELFRAEKVIREDGPDDMRDFELITPEELNEIRRIWVVDKHEIEDLLPEIYEEETGRKFDRKKMNHGQSLGSDDIDILKEVCAGDRSQFELIRELLAVEQKYNSMVKRPGLQKELEGVFKHRFYADREDAVKHQRKKASHIDEIKKKSSERIEILESKIESYEDSVIHSEE